MANFSKRMIRAAKLEVTLYEEVEADKSALGQAMGVVILSSIAAGIGTISRGRPLEMLVAVVAALIGWYIWAYLIYLIGTKLLPEPQTKADHKELLRTVGFSSSPGLIRVLGIIPGLASIVFPIAAIWMLVAMIIAVTSCNSNQNQHHRNMLNDDHMGGGMMQRQSGRPGSSHQGERIGAGQQLAGESGTPEQARLLAQHYLESTGNTSFILGKGRETDSSFSFPLLRQSDSSRVASLIVDKQTGVVSSRK